VPGILQSNDRDCGILNRKDEVEPNALALPVSDDATDAHLFDITQRLHRITHPEDQIDGQNNDGNIDNGNNTDEATDAAEQPALDASGRPY
jgi:hypothetical protein